eukprot:268458-Rhodomonas_salina.3
MRGGESKRCTKKSRSDPSGRIVARHGGKAKSRGDTLCALTSTGSSHLMSSTHRFSRLMSPSRAAVCNEVHPIPVEKQLRVIQLETRGR